MSNSSSSSAGFSTSTGADRLFHIWYGDCSATTERVAEAEQHITGQRLPPIQEIYHQRCLHRQGSQPASTNTLLQQHGWTSCTRKQNGAFYHQAAVALYSRNSMCSYHKRCTVYCSPCPVYCWLPHDDTGFDSSDTPGGYLLSCTIHKSFQLCYVLLL